MILLEVNNKIVEDTLTVKIKNALIAGYVRLEELKPSYKINSVSRFHTQKQT